MSGRCNQCCIREYLYGDEYDSDGYFCECKDLYEPAQEQNNNLMYLQLGRTNAFEAQDAETGNFDITFDLSGKLLYAHKIMITTVSTTLAAWISERWSTKDTAIKIDTYTYEEFFQFLTFLYSGTCDITQNNICRLIDMAEFFDVTLMKNDCDTMLSKMIQKIAVENVEETMEIAQKYSLSKSTGALNIFISRNMQKIIKPDVFDKFKLPFLDALLSADKSYKDEQLIFLSVFKWAEHQVSTKEPALEGTDFLDAVKTELDEIKMKFNFSNMDSDFVFESILNKDFLYSTSDFYKILEECYLQRSNEEKYFKTVFENAERQAFKEQAASIDKNFNLQTVIKRELSEILPKVDFKRMKLNFVKQFVVKKAFLFSSKESYKIIAECQRTDEKESEVFEMLYELAKNNVETRNLPGEIFHLPNAIKTELAGNLRKIKFNKMDKKYMIDFAAKTGFISREQAVRCLYVNVQINCGGKLLIEEFDDVVKIHDHGNGVRSTDSGWTYVCRSEFENGTLHFWLEI